MLPPLLNSVVVQDVRNVRNAKLDHLSNITVLYGENGSGKTTILEAINILGLSRSFRTNKIQSVICRESNSCTVFGDIWMVNKESFTPLGITRFSNGKRKIQANRLEIKRVSELAKLLPIQVIDSQTFRLLEGGPKERRQFLDWGVFHVEHHFSAHWAHLERSVKQRNSVLRNNRNCQDHVQIDVWNREICKVADTIDQMRRGYFDHFSTKFRQIWDKISSDIEIEIRYTKGWSSDRSLQEDLDRQLGIDKRRGITSVGPHRATIDILSQGKPAHLSLSRGQQKLVVSILKITQGQLLRDYSNKKTVYLLDDLPSEFDKGNRNTICRLLEDIDAQLFLTCVEKASLTECWNSESQVRMFHVEHGTVTEA